MQSKWVYTNWIIFAQITGKKEVRGSVLSPDKETKENNIHVQLFLWKFEDGGATLMTSWVNRHVVD